MNLCIAATADSCPPVWDINAVGVPEEPVIVLHEERSWVLADRAIDVVENRRLVSIHVHPVEPGTWLPKEYPRCDLHEEKQVSVRYGARVPSADHC